MPTGRFANYQLSGSGGPPVRRNSATAIGDPYDAARLPTHDAPMRDGWLPGVMPNIL